MAKQHRWTQNLTLNVYWFGLSFMWNSLHPIILPLLLLSLVNEEAKNTIYGMVTFAGLIVALVVQPLSGAFSDHTRHHLGRRRPWILLGTLLAVIWLFVLGLAKSPWVIAVGYLMLQGSSNLAHGPAQGLIPDLVPANMRGVASGAKSLFDMSGVIVASLVVGRLMGGNSPRLLLTVAVIAAILLISMVITLVGVRETPSRGNDDPPARPFLARIRETFSVDLRGQRDYVRLLISRFCMLLGTYSLQSFGLYYFHDVLQVEDPARLVGNVMAIIGVTITVIALPAGALSERWGRKRLSLIACATAAAGMGLLSLTHDLVCLFGLAGVIGLGMGIFTSVNWAWATDLVPPAEAAKYLGLSNLATAGSAATSRLLGPFIDLINSHKPNAGYEMLFVMATLSALAGLIATLYVPETRRRTATELPPA